jgi:hypothetical protein
MPIIEFLNTVAFHTSKQKEFSKEIQKCTTFESIVIAYLRNIV